MINRNPSAPDSAFEDNSQNTNDVDEYITATLASGKVKADNAFDLVMATTRSRSQADAAWLEVMTQYAESVDNH